MQELLLAVARGLVEDKDAVKVTVDEPREDGTIVVTLKYQANGEPVIAGLRRVSKPGLRIYTNCEDMPKVMKGLGTAIISTSKGVMTDKAARAAHVGGEVLAFVWEERGIDNVENWKKTHRHSRRCGSEGRCGRARYHR